MRARILQSLGACVLALAPVGCLSGAIYSHVTVPLDVNLDRTPVHEGRGAYAPDSQNSLQYYIRVDWGSNGIGDIAKKYGFTRVDYADLETLTVFGIWSQNWARVYGEKAPE